MDLQEANNELMRYKNNLNYWKKKKKIEFQKTQPKAQNLNGEKVTGGKVLNKMDSYVSTIEPIDKEIDIASKEIETLESYIDAELKRLETFEKPYKQVIILKQMGHIKGKRLTWEDIGRMTSYSEKQARRIYNKYDQQCPLD